MKEVCISNSNLYIFNATFFKIMDFLKFGLYIMNHIHIQILYELFRL